jgi:DNA-binding MarR family transcriptional regulator
MGARHDPAAVMRAPDPAEQACAQAWAALTAAHTLVTGQLGAALARTCGLSINEFQILLRVGRAPDHGVRLGELRAAVRLAQPSLSRAVARLERHGWLRRAGAPGDGRGVMVTLTAAGREVLGRGSTVHAQTIRELLLDRLTADEQDLLARALTRVAGGEPGMPPGRPAAGPAPTVPGNSPTVQEDSWPSQPHSA